MSNLEQHALYRALKCRHPLVFVSTSEEEEAAGIVVGAGIKLQRELKSWSVITGVVSGLFSEEHDQDVDTNKPELALHQLRDAPAESFIVLYDILDHIESAVVLRGLRELVHACRRVRSTVIMIDHRSDLPDVLLSEAVRIDIALPDADELRELAMGTVRQLQDDKETIVNVSKGDFQLIVNNLRGLSKRQARQCITAAALEDGKFDKADIASIQGAKSSLLQRESNLDVLLVRSDMGQLAGFTRLKKWLQARHPQNIADDVPAPRGILLLGVPGAGKSYCAQAVAGEWKVPLLRLDAGSLYNSYIGESERRLRQALAQAEAMSPVVLWIDEIEKAFAGAASQSIDGGLSQRMFGFLLTWMQEHTTQVFVVATANDIQALPPELMRKGRFDQIFFVDLPTLKTRLEILRIHSAQHGLSDQLDAAALDAIARATDGYTGAELEHGLISAKIENNGQVNGQVDVELVLHILRSSPPLASTMSERIDALRTWASTRCLSVD